MSPLLTLNAQETVVLAELLITTVVSGLAPAIGI